MWIASGDMETGCGDFHDIQPLVQFGGSLYNHLIALFQFEQLIDRVGQHFALVIDEFDRRLGRGFHSTLAERAAARVVPGMTVVIWKDFADKHQRFLPASRLKRLQIGLTFDGHDCTVICQLFPRVLNGSCLGRLLCQEDFRSMCRELRIDSRFAPC